ncbi:hypothetical protein AAF712_012571 [Marasmius tenuissimus]|uniref:t-SNARE coiled-coil homology domain-containing protein n=1 Tax=Marasmius tenuissimus TaxID=585030 RepID=A0ABR2ZH34_9AGAR
MARDRLAAMRVSSTAVPEPDALLKRSHSYPTQNETNNRSSLPTYEMSSVDITLASVGNAGAGEMSTFYAEISLLQESIRTFNDHVSQIGDLHSRSLGGTDEASHKAAMQLDELAENTRTLSTSLKGRIQALERQAGAGRDGQIRKQQTALVKSKFVEAIQNYQTIEQQYRTKYKQRMERQFKIVKPDASPEEVRAVVNDEAASGQIFQQAVLDSNRYGDSRSAYREVRERQQDLKRIEQTLADLAQLSMMFMSTLVAEQDETIQNIETQAATVEKDTEAGLGFTEKAVASARSARRKRWICFFIILIILIVIGVAVGVTVGKK